MLRISRKRRLLLGGGRQQFEEIPLRHQGDVLVRARAAGVRSMSTGVSWICSGDAVDHPVRERRERRTEAEFVEQAQRARVHGVTAEVAQEVGVLLHHGDVDAGAGEQQAKHHARGPAAGDQACRRVGGAVRGASPT